MGIPFPYDPNIRNAYLANLAARKRKKPVVPSPVPPSTTMGPNRPAADPYAAPVDPWAEAQKRAKAISDPYLAALAKQQAADTAAAQQYGQKWEQDIAGLYQQARPQIQGNYDQAIQAGARMEDAISKHLGTAGTEATGELQKMLEQIGAPSTGATVGELANIYKGASGAEFALGTSEVENLLANKTSADTWLTKQEIIDRKEVGAKVLEQLGQIAKDYGLRRDDILSAMPEQVNALYEQYAAQAKDQRDQKYKEKMDSIAVAADKRDFAYKKKQDIIAAQDARHKLYLEEKLTAQQTMSDQAYKVWAKKQDAKQKELDRQARAQLKQLEVSSRNTEKLTGQDFTGPANRKYITVQDANGNPQVIPNPNYVPPKKASASTSSSDTVATAGSAKRQRAYDNALASVFNKSTGRVRDVVAYAKDPDMKALHLINAALKGIGVQPYSKEGSQIRQALWAFLDGKPAGTGENSGKFRDPRKTNPAFGAKRKKK